MRRNKKACNFTKRRDDGKWFNAEHCTFFFLHVLCFELIRNHLTMIFYFHWGNKATTDQGETNAKQQQPSRSKWIQKDALSSYKFSMVILSTAYLNFKFKCICYFHLKLDIFISFTEFSFNGNAWLSK